MESIQEMCQKLLFGNENKQTEIQITSAWRQSDNNQ